MQAAARYDELARLLEALASPVRLAILHQLRAPRLVGDIRVQPGLNRAGENPERPLARQTVAHHVDQLVAHGLLQRAPVPDGRGEGYVLHPSSLFALLDEVRGLAKLRPLGGEGDDGLTVAQREAPAVRLPPPPRLVVAYGREDGEAFGLGEGRDEWRLGRAAHCDVRLDHDPWISSEHAVVTRGPDGFALADLRSRNGTWVDWAPVEPGRPAPLRPGALLRVGRTLLVWQPA